MVGCCCQDAVGQERAGPSARDRSLTVATCAHLARATPALPQAAKDPKKKCGKGNIALFDDDEHNIKIGQKTGYHVHFCKTVSAKDVESPTGFNRGVWKQFIIQKGLSQKGCVIM